VLDFLCGDGEGHVDATEDDIGARLAVEESLAVVITLKKSRNISNKIVYDKTLKKKNVYQSEKIIILASLQIFFLSESIFGVFYFSVSYILLFWSMSSKYFFLSCY
jgi:hypothetical protein